MNEQMMNLQKSLVNVGYDEFVAYRKACEIITKENSNPSANELQNISQNNDELYQILLNFAMLFFMIILLGFAG